LTIEYFKIEENKRAVRSAGGGLRAEGNWAKNVLDPFIFPDGGKKRYGGISDLKELKENLKVHCIPESVFDNCMDDYVSFLNGRRVLMAREIRDYFEKL